jgi:hypothetical protein
MNYTYEVVKLIPKAEFMVVEYSSEGFETYTQVFNPTMFDEDSLRALIEDFAPNVVSFWSRASEHPETVTLEKRTTVAVVPELNEPFPAPELEPQPAFNPYTHRIEMNEITDPMQETIGWTVIELSTEEKAEMIENGRNFERGKRNFLLSETDHWMFSDTPDPTQAQLDYRQALRDVPLQSGFPQNIVWPTKPE